ncbi:MAG: cupin [Burkholderiaceae bacterium]|nr:cupin [Burkholderiaceae bacterium]
MQQQEFLASIRQNGFADPVELIREANGFLDTHEHPFEARVLVIDGQIEIGSKQSSRVYQAGETFHLEKNEPHWERYGPQGVRYLSARKD